MSVFLAIDLDDAVRAQVAHVIETHRAMVDAKWLRTDKLHATLVFLGNPTADQVRTFEPHLERLVVGRSAFSLHLRGAGTFVTARAPSVLWLGVGGDLDALHALQRAASTALQADLARPYQPHLTLGRAHTAGAFEPVCAQLQAFESAPFEVRGVTLYESTHHHYRALGRSAFTPARAT